MKRIKQEFQWTTGEQNGLPSSEIDKIQRERLTEDFLKELDSIIPFEFKESNNPDVVKIERIFYVSSENPLMQILEKIDIEVNRILILDTFDVSNTLKGIVEGLNIARNIILKQSEE